ncbi:MAG: YlxM family DNA-binding protein [Clostridia bacterium]|nr:YlxM family DNA-binding protein [Clostridia bacterium]
MDEKIYEIGILFDFYGELLTGRQKSVMHYYYEENYSLGEIAEAMGVSRQAVYDALHKAEKALGNYEEKLGLAARFRQTEADIEAADEAIDDIIREHGDEGELTAKLVAVKDILRRLDE